MTVAAFASQVLVPLTTLFPFGSGTTVPVELPLSSRSSTSADGLSSCPR